MIFFELLITFFKIGLFSFGGGYGMLPLMEQEVLGHGWLDSEQFMNFLAISESTPGPISINMATFIGTTEAGILGAVCCTLGAILPSIIIILMIVTIFKRFLEYKGVKCVLLGMKPVIVGMIMATGIFMGLQLFLPSITSWSFEGINFISLALIVALSLLVFAYKKLRKKNLSPILLIIISAVLGMIVF